MMMYFSGRVLSCKFLEKLIISFVYCMCISYSLYLSEQFYDVDSHLEVWDFGAEIAY